MPGVSLLPLIEESTHVFEKNISGEIFSSLENVNHSL